MTSAVSRELRLAAICGLLVLAFGAAVAATAYAHDQIGLLRWRRTGALVAKIWIVGLLFAFAAYSIDLFVRRRPARPLQTFTTELRQNVLKPEWIVARVTAIIAWFGVGYFFFPFKVLIGHLRGFTWDVTLADADRTLFLGVDPWTLTHWLFGSVPATFALHMVYNLWFVLMCASIIYCVMRPENVVVRARYLIGFLLCWMIVGSTFAYIFASAGPCYYDRLFGGDRFAELTLRLQVIDAELKAFAPGLGVHSLRLQERLWTNFTANGAMFGGGISAAPSMHVSLAVLMACAGWQLSRQAGWLLSGFAVLISIGSIHLGWHYAIDGLLSLPLTLVIWKLSGFLVDHIVLRGEIGGLMRPVPAG